MNEVKRKVLMLVKQVDKDEYQKLKTAENFAEIKLSQCFDSLDFMIFDYHLLINFPAYQKEEPFNMESTFGDICSFLKKETAY